MNEPVTKLKHTAPISIGIMLFFVTFLTIILPLSR
ncbi:hypothetical protein SKA34_19399 [Photobacterium sp. SKA34]|nr:hypothetical protein SKA34_19399 [Photobacterium sp. SKA34]